MNNVETCQQLNGIAYTKKQSEIAQSFVFQAGKPVPISLHFEFPFSLPTNATMIVTLGTSADPDGVEYLGPVSSDISIIADEGIFGLPKYPTPYVEIIDHEKQSSCFWTTEQGLSLTNETKPFSFRLKLLTSRRSDIMGNIEIN